MHHCASTLFLWLSSAYFSLMSKHSVNPRLILMEKISTLYPITGWPMQLVRRLNIRANSTKTSLSDPDYDHKIIIKKLPIQPIPRVFRQVVPDAYLRQKKRIWLWWIEGGVGPRKNTRHLLPRPRLLPIRGWNFTTLPGRNRLGQIYYQRVS